MEEASKFKWADPEGSGQGSGSLSGKSQVAIGFLSNWTSRETFERPSVKKQQQKYRQPPPLLTEFSGSTHGLYPQ